MVMETECTQYVAAIQSVLRFERNRVYKNCQYSLLHKIFQDATYSSTNEWRYRHPNFFWSIDAIDHLAQFSGVEVGDTAAERYEFELPDPVAAREFLRQEHIVPTGVVIRRLLDLDAPPDEQVASILENARTVCIVTRDENRRLHKTKMPPKQSNFIRDKWARYRYPREGLPIKISPYACGWQGTEIIFTRRHPNELEGAP
jgi:hypothetical protein